jgi:hypothetical protein
MSLFCILILFFLPMCDLMNMRCNIKLVLLRRMVYLEWVDRSCCIASIDICETHLIWLGPVLVSLLQPGYRLLSRFLYKSLRFPPVFF